MTLTLIYFGPELPEVVRDGPAAGRLSVALFPCGVDFHSCLFFYAARRPAAAYLVERWLLEHDFGDLPKRPGYMREEAMGVTFAYRDNLPMNFNYTMEEYVKHYTLFFQAMEELDELVVPVNIITNRQDGRERLVWDAFCTAALSYLRG